MMLDTHCHLAYPALLENIDSVLGRAASAGVSHMIAIGTRLDDSRISLNLARRYAQISATAGVHPHYAKDVNEDELVQVTALFSDPRVIACGEMGLDYHYDFSPRPEQHRVFERQLDAAIAAHKPLVVHCREAVDDCLAILRRQPPHKAVFHCFTGTMDDARRILDAGYLLGFTGIITFKNTQYLREIVQHCPLDRLLIETDAPYLAPEPFRRQKNNEPALIAHVYQRIAELKGIDLQPLVGGARANASSLFGLLARE